jgi:hypothetical protein
MTFVEYVTREQDSDDMTHGKYPVRSLCMCVRNLLLALMASFVGGVALAQDSSNDAKYIAQFHEQFAEQNPVPILGDYVSVARYDKDWMGEKLEQALRGLNNDTGGIAWGLSYRMMSLNEMYRLTGDTKYLAANLKCVRAVMAVRDDKTEQKLWTGTVVPAWSSAKYAKRGRAVFGVHTGMITFPMFDFLLMAKDNAEYRQQMGGEFDAILKCANEALSVHDRQWRDGPGAGEGHYIMMDQEDGTDGKIKPGNRLSALGRALWVSWKVTANTVHRDRALAMGRFIKNRLVPSADGAYYWEYWLPNAPVSGPVAREKINGEDISHASLTASFPYMLAADGEVFDAADMKRMAKTVLNGFGRLTDGAIFGDITGHSARGIDLARSPGRWLPFAAYDPGVRARLVSFYLHYEPQPTPLDIAFLLRYGK